LLADKLDEVGGGQAFDVDMVEVSVKNTGIGISPDDQKKLFQPFIQVDDALSRKFEGTGLGHLQSHREIARWKALGEKQTWQGQHLQLHNPDMREGDRLSQS